MREKPTKPEEHALIDIQSITVGEYTYQVKLAPALTALRAASIVANVVSPLFAGLSSVQGARGAFARAITYFFQSPDLGDNLEKLVVLFAPTTQIVSGGGRRTASLEKCVDEHFAGRLDALMKWLSFCLKINLSSFLDAMPALAEEAAGAAEAFGLSVPKGSGTSGGSGESSSPED